MRIITEKTPNTNTNNGSLFKMNQNARRTGKFERMLIIIFPTVF